MQEGQLLQLLMVATAAAATVAAAVAAAATSDLEGWYGQSSSCAPYPPGQPAPRLTDPSSGAPQGPQLQFNVPRLAYENFARNHRAFQAASSAGTSGGGGGCCGLAPGAPVLVVSELEILPAQVHAGKNEEKLLTTIATLLPFDNTLLAAQDAQIMSALQRLVHSNLFGRVSLYHYVERYHPDLLAWISQGHLFCLTQRYDSDSRRSLLRLVMTRPLNSLEAVLSPFRMRFRLAPCVDRSDDNGRAASFSATVRLLQF